MGSSLCSSSFLLLKDVSNVHLSLLLLLTSAASEVEAEEPDVEQEVKLTRLEVICK